MPPCFLESVPEARLLQEAGLLEQTLISSGFFPTSPWDVPTKNRATPAARVPELWDGQAARRIVDVLEEEVDRRRSGPVVENGPAR